MYQFHVHFTLILSCTLLRQECFLKQVLQSNHCLLYLYKRNRSFTHTHTQYIINKQGKDTAVVDSSKPGEA